MSAISEPDNTTFPPEPKVVAATTGAGTVAFLLTLISNLVQDQDTGVLIGGGVPEWLEPVIAGVLAALAAFLPGYQARHQHRRPVPPVLPADPPY